MGEAFLDSYSFGCMGYSSRTIAFSTGRITWLLSTNRGIYKPPHHVNACFSPTDKFTEPTNHIPINRFLTSHVPTVNKGMNVTES